MSTVAVVGGGLSGLVTARHLALAGHEVTVLEAGPRLGGKIAAGTLAGVSFDVGAESMLARTAPGQHQEVLELLSALGCEVIGPEPVKAQLLVDGRIRPMPRSQVGIPYAAEDLVDLLTPAGLERAHQEPELPVEAPAADVSIGDLVDARFGPEVTDRLLEPMLGGVYAGHARRLSAAAVSPAIWQRIAQGLALSRTAPAPDPAAGPPMVSTPGGLHTVVDRLVADLETHTVRLGRRSTVRQLRRRGTGWALTVGPTTAEETVTADAVVLATAAAPTARLLDGIVADTIRAELSAVPYASVAVIAVVASGLEISGSGLLVPPGELPSIKAFTHASRKWGWVRAAVDQSVGADHELVRISVGRAGQVAALQLDDRALIADVLDQAQARVPGWADVRIAEATVQRWGGGLPQYEVGHLDAVARWQDAVGAVPGLAVCGALWDGVGLAGCLRSARAAAAAIG